MTDSDADTNRIRQKDKRTKQNKAKQTKSFGIERQGETETVRKTVT